MRIAVDARPLAIPHNGIGRYIRALLPHLTQAGQQWLIYSDRPVTLPAGTCANVIRHGNVTNRGLSTLYAQRYFAHWAKHDHADVFWSPRHHLPLLSRIPAVVTVHDLVWRKAPLTMRYMARIADRLLMPPAIHRSRAILVPSQATAQDLRELFPAAAGKIHVTPLASNLSAYSTGPTEPTKPYFLFVGTLEPRKNLVRVIDAFESLLEANPSLPHRLLIAGGSGWKNRDVMKRLTDPATGERLRYLGPVEDQQLAQLYASAYCVVAPSLYEGFGLQILESMSFGAPVITSNVSSMPEVAGDAGLLVNPLSTESIARAMLQLATDRNLREELSRRALLRARLYSWKETADRTLRVLEGIK